MLKNQFLNVFSCYRYYSINIFRLHYLKIIIIYPKHVRAYNKYIQITLSQNYYYISKACKSIYIFDLHYMKVIFINVYT